MPYTVRKNSKGRYEIIRISDGSVVGTSDTKAKAEASVRARYAGENKK